MRVRQSAASRTRAALAGCMVYASPCALQSNVSGEHSSRCRVHLGCCKVDTFRLVGKSEERTEMLMLGTAKCMAITASLPMHAPLNKATLSSSEF